MSTHSSQQPGSSMTGATKRLLNELRLQTESAPHPFLLSLGPVSDAQMLQWEAVMKGVPRSAYEGTRTDFSPLSHPILDSHFDAPLEYISSRTNTDERTWEKTAGQWKLSISIPDSYPKAPPSVQFVTPVCHPNVHFKTGEICLDLLKASWSPVFTIVSTLEAVHQLLAYPEVDSPLNVDVAALLRNGDSVGAEGLVRWCCREWRWGEGGR